MNHPDPYRTVCQTCDSLKARIIELESKVNGSSTVWPNQGIHKQDHRCIACASPLYWESSHKGILPGRAGAFNVPDETVMWSCKGRSYHEEAPSGIWFLKMKKRVVVVNENCPIGFHLHRKCYYCGASWMEETYK